MRIHASLSVAAVTVFVAAFSSRARADSNDAERAELLFTEASELLSQEKYAEACPKLEESQRLDPALGTQFNLAGCFEKVGKLASAWRHYRDVERLAHASGKTSREEIARQRLAALRARVSFLEIVVASSDVTVSVDGERQEPGDLAFVVVDPGEHTVVASAPAHSSWESHVRVPSGDGAPRRVTVDVPKLVRLGESKVVTVTTESTSTRRAVGLGFLGLGIAGVAGAVVTGILVLDAKSTADAACSPTCTTDDGRDAVSRGKTLLPINAVTWGVSAVGLGVGSYLFLTSRPKAPTTTGVRAVPFAGPQASGLALEGRF